MFIYIYVYVYLQQRIYKCKYTDTYTYLYIHTCITSFIGGAVGGLPLLMKEKKAVSNIMLCGSAMAYSGEVFFVCGFIYLYTCLEAHIWLVCSWARGVLGCWCTCLCMCVCLRVFFEYIHVCIRPGCLCLCVYVYIYIYI